MPALAHLVTPLDLSEHVHIILISTSAVLYKPIVISIKAALGISRCDSDLLLGKLHSLTVSFLDTLRQVRTCGWL